jgi:hypothetical protein
MVVQIGNNCLLNARRKVYCTPKAGVLFIQIIEKCNTPTMKTARQLKMRLKKQS